MSTGSKNINPTSKLILGININEVVLPNDIKSNNNLHCQILNNQNKIYELNIDKNNNKMENIPILSYSDKIQIIIIEENATEQIGSITFHAKLFANFKGKTIQRWITLFDLPYDDEYDGDLLDDDEEIPKIHISFTVDIPSKIEGNLKNTSIKYGNSISTIIEIKEETSPDNNFSSSKGIDQEKQIFPIVIIPSEENSKNKSDSKPIKNNCPSSQSLPIQQINCNHDQNDSTPQECKTQETISNINQQKNILASLNTSEILKMSTVESSSSLDLNVFQNWNYLTPNPSKIPIGSSHEDNNINSSGNTRSVNLTERSTGAIKIDPSCSIRDTSQNLNNSVTNNLKTSPEKHEEKDNAKVYSCTDDENFINTQASNTNSVQSSNINIQDTVKITTSEQQQLYELTGYPLKVESEQKLSTLNPEVTIFKDKENSLTKISGDIVHVDKKFEEMELNYKEQIKKLIDQNKSLTIENTKLKQKLSIPSSFSHIRDLDHNCENYLNLYKLEVEKSNELSTKYQTLSHELKNKSKLYEDELATLKGNKITLEETISCLRSDIQKLSFKLMTIEAENKSKNLINENYLRENEEYKKNIKLLTEKFEEYNDTKESEIKANKEELNEIKNENNSIKRENNVLKLELSTIKQQILDEEKEKAMLIKEYDRKINESENKIKEVMKQFHDQSIQIDKLTFENTNLMLKAEELKELSNQNQELQAKYNEIKTENEKLKISLTSSQEKLLLTANELAKNTALANNQNQIIAQLNQTIKILESNNSHSLSTQSLGQTPQQQQQKQVLLPVPQSQLSTSQRSIENNTNPPLSQLNKISICDDNLQQSSHTSSIKSTNSSNSDIKSIERNQSPCFRLANQQPQQQSDKINRPSTKNTSLNISNRNERIFDSQTSANYDPIDFRINEYISTVNPPIIPIRISEGQYRFGTKKIAISIINDILYVKILGGYIPAEDFFKWYGRIEMNKVKKIKSNEIEYSNMAQEAIAPELRHLILWNENLIAMQNYNNNPNGIQTNKNIDKNKYCSQSPKKSRENVQRMLNVANDSNSKNKKLTVDITKSNDTYHTKNKIQQLDNSPKYANIGNSIISPKSNPTRKGGIALDNITNNQGNTNNNNNNNNIDTNSNGYCLQVPQTNSNNIHVPNLFANYTENNDFPNNTKTPVAAIKTNNTNSNNNNNNASNNIKGGGSTVEKVTLHKVNLRKC